MILGMSMLLHKFFYLMNCKLAGVFSLCEGYDFSDRDFNLIFMQYNRFWEELIFWN